MTLENDFNTLIGEMEDNLQAMGVLDAEFDPTTGLRGLTARILDIEPSIGGLDLDTAVNITANPSTIIVGQSVILTSKLTASYDDETIVDVDLTGVLTGATIQYKEGNTVLGTGITDNTGVATCTLSGLTLGTHTVKAVFPGTENFNDCESSNITITVNNLEPASITLAKTGGKQILSYADRAGGEEFCELTATVLDAGDNPVPGVNVSLYKDNVVWDTISTDSNGQVTKTYYTAGGGDVEFYAECGSLVTERYDIEDCLKCYSGTYSTRTVANYSLPTNYKLEFIIYVSELSNYDDFAYIRFDRSSGGYIGKGASNSNKISVSGISQTLTVPIQTDVKYTFIKNNGNVSLSDGTNSISVSSNDFNSIYEFVGSVHSKLKNLKVKPL